MNVQCGDGISVDYESTPSSGSSEHRPLTVVDLLRKASVVLDAMWREALLGTGGDAAIRFGDASHGVHRALIALDSFDSHWPAALDDADLDFIRLAPQSGAASSTRNLVQPG